MPNASTTVLRGGTLLAHDGTGHRILRDGDLAFDGVRITYVGPRRESRSASIEDMRGKLLLPGFVSARTDLLAAAFDPLLSGAPRSGPAYDDRNIADAIRWGLARLLRAGVTTVVECGVPATGADVLLALAAELRIRLYYAPPIDLATSDEAGDGADAALDRAIGYIERMNMAGKGNQHGILSLKALDSVCARLAMKSEVTGFPDEACLRSIARAAERHIVPIALDFGDSAFAFHHLLRVSGMTPVAWLAQLGLLGARTLLRGGHCLSGLSGSAYPHATDGPLIAAAGATFVTTPLADAQRGIGPDAAMQIQAAGGNIAIGVTASPLDMLEEMRAFTLAGKAVSGNHEAATARDAFVAATTGAAAAIGRRDLGRLAAGAQADIVVLDLNRTRIGPIIDPVRSLVACADSEMFERVIVGGRDVVRDGDFIAANETAAVGAPRTSIAASGRS